jgi:lipopolysaccharide export system permease protein
MKIKDRYIAKTLLTYTLVVLFFWLSIYSFFNFLSELNSVGIRAYKVIDAFKYILLKIPGVAYGQVSPVILLGCILGMGHLASTAQLVILRASGVSILRITWITLKNAILFLIFIALIGETVAPTLTTFAENQKSSALGKISLINNQDGFWIRDGSNFINVEKNIDGSLFNGITVIEVNQSNKIERLVRSESAEFDGSLLNMSDSRVFSIDNSGIIDEISVKERSYYNKTVSFDKDLLKSLSKEPKDLKTWSLVRQVQFLSDNKLRSGIFQVELYTRLVKPLTLIAMILLAMLFIFGSTRDASLGRKIFFGVAIGLSFELISRIGGALSLSYEFSPLLSSFVPPILVIFVAMTLLIKKSTQ